MRSLRVGNWGNRDGIKFACDIPYGDGGYWPRLESGVVDPESKLVKQVRGRSFALSELHWGDDHSLEGEMLWPALG